MDLSPLLAVRLAHLIALALAVGAATAKNVLLYRCKADPGFAPVFLQVERPITLQILLGQARLTFSGIAYAWLLRTGLTLRLGLKVGLVASLWVLGPALDKIASPAFRQAVPAPGQPITEKFTRSLNRDLAWDLAASGLYYAIVVWVPIS